MIVQVDIFALLDVVILPSNLRHCYYIYDKA